jgi:lipid II:glycine glycyltransferase (peptidoglycan interpeptide bridge formation enzyme)
MQIVQKLDNTQWRQYVDNHRLGNIFHTPEMFQAYASAQGYYPTLWAAVNDSGKICALFLPVHITLLGSLLRPFTGRAVSFGSVLSSEDEEGRRGLELLLETYNHKTKNEALFTELRNLADISYMLPSLDKHGFAYEEHLNFLIDLDRPVDQIWANIRSNARRNIQKARKMEVVIEDDGDIRELPEAYQILKEVYKRIQVPLPDRSLFESAYKVLHPCGMLKMLLAKVDGNIAGVLFLLLYKDVVFYWYTGTSRQYSLYRTNDLLVWAALEFGQRNGYRSFDFGGGGKPEEEYGVRDFKAKFGGELVNFGRNVRIHSPARFKLSQEGYQLVRRFL